MASRSWLHSRSTVPLQGPARSSGRRLSRRASLNAVAAGLDYVALITVEFIVNPLLVSGLGNYLYGAWRVLWKLTGYLWATSGRSAPALQWAIASRQYSTDYDEKRQYVASAIVVWFLFLPLLAIVGGLGVWFAPGLLRTPPEYVNAVRMAAGLLVADSIALTLLSMPRAVLQGENLGYKRMGLSALLVGVGGGLTVLALHLDTGIVGVAAANLVNTLLTAALFWRVARRYVPWFKLARPTRQTVRWFLGLSWWFTAWKFVSELMAAGDVLVLALFAPVELVTVYTLTKYIPDAVAGLLAKPLQGVAPGLGGIIGSGDFRKAIRVRNQLMSFMWLVVVGAGAAVLLWNESFVTLWVGSQYYSGPLSTLLIVIMAMQYVFIRNDASVIDLTLNVRRKVLLGAVSTVLSAVLGAVLVSWWEQNIVGLCTGFIAGRSILTLGYPWLVGRAVGHPLRAQLLATMRPLATTIVVFAAALVVGRYVTADTWIGLVLGGGATAAIAGIGASFLGLTGDQRRRLIQRLRQAAGVVGRIRTP